MGKSTGPLAQRHRGKFTEDEVNAHLRRQQSSELSLPQYCKVHQLPYHGMVWWRRKLHGPARPRRQKSAAFFIPVEVKPTARADRQCDSGQRNAVGSGSSMELILKNGHTIRVATDFETQALRRLIAAVEAPSC